VGSYLSHLKFTDNTKEANTFLASGYPKTINWSVLILTLIFNGSLHKQA